MFYNPKWTPLTLDHLIGWLEAKPLDEYFSPDDPKTCLFGQYYREYGFDPVVDVSDIENEIGIPANVGTTIILGCETFGEALYQFKELKCRIEEMNSPTKQS